MPDMEKTIHFQWTKNQSCCCHLRKGKRAQAWEGRMTLYLSCHICSRTADRVIRQPEPQLWCFCTIYKITVQWHFPRIYFLPLQHLSNHAHAWVSAVTRNAPHPGSTTLQKGSQAVVICVAHTKHCPAKAWFIFLESIYVTASSSPHVVTTSSSPAQCQWLLPPSSCEHCFGAELGCCQGRLRGSGGAGRWGALACPVV